MMRQLTLLLLAAACSLAATSTRDYRTLLDEPAPTSLPVPVAGVRLSQLRDTWGDARSDNRTHEGIDIFARRGTPVLSATHGYVSSVQVRGLGGNTVSVQGPGGHRHYYAHLESYGRYVEGDWVDAGDTIGFVGTTGNAQGTSPHLHYGIYTRDGAVNPYPYLTGTDGASSDTRASRRGEAGSSESKTGTTARGPKSQDHGTKSPEPASPRNTDAVPASTSVPSPGTAATTRRR